MQSSENFCRGGEAQVRANGLTSTRRYGTNNGIHVATSVFTYWPSQVIISKDLAKHYNCKDKVEAVTKFRNKVKKE